MKGFLRKVAAIMVMMMAKGLSRNQSNYTIMLQRAEGSKDVSNACYYRVFEENLDPILDSFVREAQLQFAGFVLK